MHQKLTLSVSHLEVEAVHVAVRTHNFDALVRELTLRTCLLVFFCFCILTPKTCGKVGYIRADCPNTPLFLIN